jgi:hypothetical protein
MMPTNELRFVEREQADGVPGLGGWTKVTKHRVLQQLWVGHTTDQGAEWCDVPLSADSPASVRLRAQVMSVCPSCGSKRCPRANDPWAQCQYRNFDRGDAPPQQSERRDAQSMDRAVLKKRNAEICMRLGITMGHLREDGSPELKCILERLDKAEAMARKLVAVGGGPISAAAGSPGQQEHATLCAMGTQASWSKGAKP